MSKIGNHIVEVQETREYELGWKCFELGQSRDCLHWKSSEQGTRFLRGWDDAKRVNESHYDC